MKKFWAHFPTFLLLALALWLAYKDKDSESLLAVIAAGVWREERPFVVVVRR